MRRYSVVAAVALVACEAAPHEVLIDIRYGDATLEADVVSIDLEILDGNCVDGTWRDGLFVLRGEDAEILDPLPPGAYAFRAVAGGASCNEIAEVCVERALPLADPVIELELVRLVSERSLCGADEACVDRRCARREPEVCDTADNDLDGMVDEDFDLATDEFNCGACGTVCVAGDHAVPECVGGLCDVVCDAGWDDCDADPVSCERSVVTAEDCGSCNAACGGGTPVCADGECSSTCGVFETDCTGSCVNTDDDPDHCGACGNVCTASGLGRVPVCIGGSCDVACATGYDECSGVCVNLDSDVDNCDTCGNECILSRAVPSCSGGICTIDECHLGWANCDMMRTNGCERDVDNEYPGPCGDCVTGCALGETCCLNLDPPCSTDPMCRVAQ